MRQPSLTIVTLGVMLLAAPSQAETPAEILKKPLPLVFDPSAIDHSVKPCSDFYRYACGAWLKANPIPPSESSWYRYSDLDDNITAVLATLLEEAASGQGDKTAQRRKIGDYYASCVDEAGIEERGLKPFQPELQRIAAIKSNADFAAEIAHLHRIGTSPLFFFSSTPDYTDTSMVIATADQDGFTLPDRDYYLTGDYKAERNNYRAHVTRMLRLLGDDESRAKREANAVLRIETALAKASMSLVDQREPNNIHHKMTLEAFMALTPSFDWKTYLAAIGVPSFSELDVADPGFFRGIEPVLKSLPLDDWKSYLRWTLIHGLVSVAPRAFVEEDFAFFGRRLDGQEEIGERWKACVDAIDDQLGDALGRAYVEREFSASARERVLAMMHAIEREMHADIGSIDWMSETTKARALEKLANMGEKVGYPDSWLDYSNLKIVRGDALGNATRAADFAFTHEIRKIGKPFDRGEWGATPPTNNSYYDDQAVDMTFPAGLLQLPNFDPNADDAVNYGNLGALIGHELTHGFDDEGRHYDAQGNLKDWWTKRDAKAFETRAEGFVREYGRFVAVKDSSHPRKDVMVDGELTLGENTADNGGAWLAYEAFLKTANARDGKDGLGFTPAQRFFLSYAQGWCENETPESAKEDAKTDEHAPGKYRVNGVVMNMQPFREAFACKVGTPMAPAKVNRVW
jgi:putative endopeptidase